jgi:hypothetical protein
MTVKKVMTGSIGRKEEMPSAPFSAGQRYFVTNIA